MTQPPLTLYLAAPRGFCAGVDRAIKIVEMALQKWGAPVYVRHEIVHNKFVVDSLRDQGAVFVEELDECPDDRPVIFSAHGVPKAVPAAAEKREMIYVDATCPLVSKVHIEAERHAENGLQIVMIGHAGHPETIGTMGQLPEGEVLLVETEADVATLDADEARLHARLHGGGQGAGRQDRRDARRRRAQFLHFPPAGRGRGKQWLRLCPAGAARHRYRLART